MTTLPIRLMALPKMKSIRTVTTQLAVCPNHHSDSPRPMAADIRSQLTIAPSRGTARLTDIAAATLLDVHLADTSSHPRCSCTWKQTSSADWH